MKKKRWTTAEVTQLETLWGKKKVREIAKILGRTKMSVLLKGRYGLNLTPLGKGYWMKKFVPEQARNLLAEGKSIHDLALFFNMSDWIIKERLRKYNIEWSTDKALVGRKRGETEFESYCRQKRKDFLKAENLHAPADYILDDIPINVKWSKWGMWSLQFSNLQRAPKEMEFWLFGKKGKVVRLKLLGVEDY